MIIGNQITIVRDEKTRAGVAFEGKKETDPLRWQLGDNPCKAVQDLRILGTPNPVTGNFQIGDRIQNRWEIQNILKGGMGIVYFVYDHEAHDAFAVKTITDELIKANPNAPTRFTQEAVAWVNLDYHINVVAARMVRTINGKPYIFLELVTGGDLGQWIGTARLTKDIVRILVYALQFCDGISHAFSKGIKVHRDIKPSNCLITGDNILKVTDFGLAKAFDDVDFGAGSAAPRNVSWMQERSLSLTQTGFGVGTCTHMAPEQFDDAKHVDVPADIYSFGVMLYQMVTGQLPFMGQAWQDFKHLHQTRQPPQFHCQNRELQKVIYTCLEKAPGNRYQSFGVVRQELGRIYETVAGDAVWKPMTGVELDATAWTNKGASLAFLGRHQEAIACFDRALQMNPRDSLALYNKGNIMGTAFHRLDEANSFYDRALAINPREFRAWSNKAAMFWGMGRHREQFECCEKALAINPYDARALTLKGISLRSSAKHEAALDCFNKALEADPNFILAWISKGTSLTALNRFSEAISCFDHLITSRSSFEQQAWLEKGIILMQLKQPESAISCFDQAVNLNPKDARAWLIRGECLENLRRFNDALQSFENALSANPKNMMAWVKKGFLLGVMGNLSIATECIQKAQNLGYADGPKLIALLREKLNQQ
jgi:tetratricopeptide (TPR) repeat protein